MTAQPTPLETASLEKTNYEIQILKVELDLKTLELHTSKRWLTSALRNPIYIGAAVTIWVGLVSAIITYSTSLFQADLEAKKMANNFALEREKLQTSFYLAPIAGKDLNEITAKMIYILETCQTDASAYREALSKLLARLGSKPPTEWPDCQKALGPEDPTFFKPRF